MKDNRIWKQYRPKGLQTEEDLVEYEGRLCEVGT
jgi:hypothetical protein